MVMSHIIHHIIHGDVYKRQDNSGSRGIYLVSNIEDAESISVAYSYSHSFSRNGDLVVEEYMIGPEVSVETLTVNGECNVIQITDKITTGAPHFVEMGHTQPSQLPENTKQTVAPVSYTHLQTGTGKGE